MNFKLVLLLLFSMLPNLAAAGSYRCQDANGYYAYSNKPCATEAVEENSQELSPSQDPQSGQNPNGREAYTKNMEPMRSPDAATQACFSYLNTTARFPDPSTTRLLSSSRKWVSVRNVGARQMVNIAVTSMNAAGMYVGVQSYSCLLMGDGVTVNTSPYELL